MQEGRPTTEGDFLDHDPGDSCTTDLTLNTHLSARTMRHPLHPPSSLSPHTHTHTYTHTHTHTQPQVGRTSSTTSWLGFSLQAGGPLPAKYHITPWPPARTTTTLASNLFVLYQRYSHFNFNFSHCSAWIRTPGRDTMPRPRERTFQAEHNHHQGTSSKIHAKSFFLDIKLFSLWCRI